MSSYRFKDALMTWLEKFAAQPDSAEEGFCSASDQRWAHAGHPLSERCSGTLQSETPARGLRPSQALLLLTWKSQPKAQLQTKLQVKAPAGGVYKVRRSQGKWLGEWVQRNSSTIDCNLYL